jgi:uncharacterized protein YjeT (DUF2065 family)
MDSSILIARLLGPVLVVVGAAALIQPDRVRRLAREFLDGEALLFLSGLLTLTAGLAVVNTHNRWQAGWPVVITLLGWLMALAGIGRLLLPDTLKAIGSGMIEKTGWLRAPGAAFLALGAFLAWHGYLE